MTRITPIGGDQDRSWKSNVYQCHPANQVPTAFYQLVITNEGERPSVVSKCDNRVHVHGTPRRNIASCQSDQ
jgi:hypothetical protein